MSAIYTGEPKRGCGYRKVGGLYLVGDKAAMLPCKVMPWALLPCQHCGQTINFSRGYTWVKPGYFATECKVSCPAQTRCVFTAPTRITCPACDGEGAQYECELDKVAGSLGVEGFESTPCKHCQGTGSAMYKVGLLWVGREYYTTESFVNEATTLGISKRLATVPRDLVLGKTWVMLASKHVLPCPNCTDDYCEVCEGKRTVSAVFYAFKPDRLEMIVTQDMLDQTCDECKGTGKYAPDDDTADCRTCGGHGVVPSKLAERLERQHITPVIVEEKDLEDEDEKTLAH